MATKAQKLKKILYDLSSPEERQELDFLEKSKGDSILGDKLEEMTSIVKGMKPKDYEESFKSLMKAFSRYAEYNKQVQEEFASDLSEKFNKLTGTLTTSFEKNKPFNAAGVYKDMINQLSAIDESIKNKPVPVWNWPQYASVGVRDKNFANVDPAIAPFGITTTYDDVVCTYDGSNNLTTATYKFNGQTVAQITCSYDGSGNLTSAQRTA